MYLGRTVAVLPQDRAEFAPEHAMNVVFQNIPQSLHEIGKHTLPSLVYHSDFIIEHLNSNSAVLKSIRFSDRNLLSNLNGCSSELNL